jgi:hypothetical protein
MKKDKQREKLSLDDLEIESFETKVAPVVTGASHLGSCSTTCNSSILSCQHSSCSSGGPC